jgi:hypothetical protein
MGLACLRSRAHGALALVLIGWVVPAVAEFSRPSPYQAQISLSQVYEVASRPGSGKDVEAVPTVTVQGRVRGVGFVDARFNIKRNKTWRSSVRRNGKEESDQLTPVLLQGKLAVGGSWRKAGRRIHPSAAAIIGKELKVTFPGRVTGSRGSRQRVYTIRMTLDGSIVVKARVSSIPRSVGRRGACGAEIGTGSLATVMQSNSAEQSGVSEASQGIIPPVTANNESGSTVLARVVTISTDADPEWYQKYGEQSNAVIASIINAAEAIYNRQLGVRFRIVKQHVYSDSSPYVSNDAGLLLSSFTRNEQNPFNLGSGPENFLGEVDLKHLFTGKDIDGSIIGIAYIGVVCAVPSLSFGITQAYMDVADPGIFAHEVAHNFGAGHDSSTREGLMYPAITIPPAEKFSDFSLGEITSHISKYGSCLSLEQVAPRPDETPGGAPIPPIEPPLSSASLSIRRDRVGDPRDPVVRLSGTLVAQNGTPLGNVGVRLMVSGEPVGTTVTSDEGAFKFFVKMDLPKRTKVYVYVETEGGEVFSNFLWVGRTKPLTPSDSRRIVRRARS